MIAAGGRTSSQLVIIKVATEPTQHYPPENRAKTLPELTSLYVSATRNS